MGAILAGMIFGVVLSILMDAITEKSGSMKWIQFNANSTGIILFALFYRTVINVSGSYLTGRLPLRKPMSHALILGSIGFIVALTGALVIWDFPPWYWLAVALGSMCRSGELLATRNTKILFHH